MTYSSLKIPGMVRYFDTVDEDAKPSRSKKIVCKRCGAEGEHKSSNCPVLIVSTVESSTLLDRFLSIMYHSA